MLHTEHQQFLLYQYQLLMCISVLLLHLLMGYWKLQNWVVFEGMDHLYYGIVELFLNAVFMQKATSETTEPSC